MTRSTIGGWAAVCVAGLALGCGGGAGTVKDKTGPSACDRGEVLLKQRLGPEFNEALVHQTFGAPNEPPPGADQPPPPATEICALTYNVRPEEMITDDLPPDEVTDPALDHRLAVSVPEAGTTRYVLHMLPAADADPAAVTLKLDARDITEDGNRELVVVADSPDAQNPYRGIRIFQLAVGAAPKVIFDEPAVLTTGEGLTLLADWKAGQAGDKRAIVFDAAGTMRIFTWSPEADRFIYDEARTQAMAPRPAAPAVPETDVPGEPAGEAAPTEEKAAEAPAEDTGAEDKGAAPSVDDLFPDSGGGDGSGPIEIP